MAASRLMRIGSILLPGALVAATGVGAGDLATAGFAGMRLGVAVLWAIVLGAFLKFVLTEGLARWQLATGETILDGALTRFGRPAQVVFLLYFLPWTFFTAAALMSACGVAAQAILGAASPFQSPAAAKLVLGAAHSLIGVLLVWLGGFRLFERVMAVCIGVMFVAVVVTAALLGPDLGAVLRGLVVPSIPQADAGGIVWTIALLGGVGGTLTVICYGYWIRAVGRTTAADVRTCRIDLGVGYVLTAIFGMSMLIIASRVQADGSGVGLVVGIGNRLHEALGPAARWLFLVGAWAAVFSSLLGVWQAVPYIFGDYLRVVRGRHGVQVEDRWLSCRVYLLALAIVPLVQVQYRFEQVQKAYAVFGAAFIPMLALVLLLLNSRRSVGAEHRNRPLTVLVLIVTLLLTAWAGYESVARRQAPPPPMPAVPGDRDERGAAGALGPGDSGTALAAALAPDPARGPASGTASRPAWPAGLLYDQWLGGHA